MRRASPGLAVIVADSDVLIDFLSGRDPAARRVEIELESRLIAGIVMTHDALLLTRNRKHFERVEGLKLATLA